MFFLVSSCGKSKNDKLLEVSWKGDARWAERLINQGADVNTHDRHSAGRTPLIYSMINQHFKLAELLLSRGANIDDTDDNGNTALMMAAWNGNKDLVELLLKNNASINNKNKDGETALIKAAKRTTLFNLPSKYYSEKKMKETVELLISKGADLNERDKEGKSALKYAIVNKHKVIEDILRQAGALE